jgi:hypothetical protein
MFSAWMLLAASVYARACSSSAATDPCFLDEVRIIKMTEQALAECDNNLAFHDRPICPLGQWRRLTNAANALPGRSRRALPGRGRGPRRAAAAVPPCGVNYPMAHKAQRVTIM